MLLLAFWLRALGMQGRLFFQTDNGSEFGGLGGSRKRILMQRYIFDPLGVTLLSTPVREKQVNTFVERSHRTDDEEFYALNLTRVTSRSSFLAMAQRFVLYYNFARPHMGRAMQGRTPMEVLCSLRKGTSPILGAFPVLVLDRVSSHLFRLWDISRIPWDNSPKNRKEGLVNETLEHYTSEENSKNSCSSRISRKRGTTSGSNCFPRLRQISSIARGLGRGTR